MACHESLVLMVVVGNGGEIEVPDGEIWQICGQELEEPDEVTGTGNSWVLPLDLRKSRGCFNVSRDGP